jgi:cell division septum initiation protein DivIVA
MTLEQLHAIADGITKAIKPLLAEIEKLKQRIDELERRRRA